MLDFLLFTYIVMIGFVTAGLCASTKQLVTGTPLVFKVDKVKGVAIFGAAVIRVVAGPMLLMRHALRDVFVEGRPASWLVLPTIIAGIWSFFSGVVVLELLLNLGRSLAG